MLRTRIQGGNPPDVAIIPGIGTLRSLARDGSLIPHRATSASTSRDIEGNYAPGILDVGVVDDELYGIMVKLNSKATIWYSPERFAEIGVEPAEDFGRPRRPHRRHQGRRRDAVGPGCRRQLDPDRLASRSST